MRKLFLLMAALLAAAGAQAQGKGFSFRFYGQVRADLFYNSRANEETVDGLFYMYPKDIEPDADGRDLNATPNGSFYVLYTRLGLDLAGPAVGKARTSAKIEADFRGSGTDYSLPRIRQAYVQLDWAGSSLLVGQTWHPLYGDVAPQVMNLSTGAPFQPFSRAPMVRYGRYLNPMDMTIGRKVCVIGRRIYTELFPEGGDPCGKSLRIDSIYYEIVGVDYRSSNAISIGGSADEAVVVPLSVVQRAYNRGSAVDMIAVTARPGVVMSELAGRIRGVVARAHVVDPADEQGVMVFNTEILFAMLDNLFRGVGFLTWLIGIGTLLAGAIGVSNIMMVTVRERTSEIGIRRAIGATPRMIMGQVMAESVALTAVAGAFGIMLAVAVLQMIELANTTDGVAAASFQVGFGTALLAAALLCLLGMAAGLAPAWRAMKVKPVDAMREE